MTDPNRVDPDRLEEYLEEVQRWLDERWNEAPLSVDETVKVLRDLVDLLCLVADLPLQAVDTAARQVGLEKQAALLGVLANLAARLAGRPAGER